MGEERGGFDEGAVEKHASQIHGRPLDGAFITQDDDEPSYGRSVSRYAVCIPAYRSGPLLVAWNKPFPCILGPQEATPLDRQADEKEEGQVR